MKAALVFSLFFLILPIAFFVPFIGINAYIWFGYLRLHEWAYMPLARFSLFIAVTTLAGYLIFEISKRPPRLMVNWLICLLWAQMCISTVFAYSLELAQPKFIEFSKILLIAILITSLVDSEWRARFLYVSTVIAIGLLATRSTISVLLTGGAFRTDGPGGMFEDNNDYALLLVTALPLMVYLARNEQNKWLKCMSIGFAAMNFITIFFTRSRGGFVALCVMLLAMAFKSKYKITGLIGSAAVLLIMLSIAPLVVIERLNTIKTGTSIDESAQLRLKMWGISREIILDHPVTGVGPGNMMDWRIHHRYDEEERPRVSHNAYLQIGVDGGIPAMVYFIGIILLSYWRLGRTRNLLKARAPDSLIIHYTHGLQLALIGYGTAAMFASRHDLELLYQIAALAGSYLLIARKYMHEAEMHESAAETSAAPVYAQ
ncbi:MAG: putative O-glycosylation ligase, exosortase A system-associated [Acidobacteria bacterium]|nr:putative O-glycosylation ligase, exosortase A system-associated [Acidobacteriota bacterium]